MGIRIRHLDWGLRLGIKIVDGIGHLNCESGSGIGNEDFGLGLGLGIRIGNWDWRWD